MIRIDQVGEKGRGVVATRNIARGEVFERAPVLVVPACEWDFVDETFLGDYVYRWGDTVAVGLGLASFFNHSYSPNARYLKNLLRSELEFVALRDIAAEEEILVNYNEAPDDPNPVWFEVLE